MDPRFLEQNLNSICRGYMKRALDSCEVMKAQTKKKILGKLCYAFDMMTIEEAVEYDEGKYHLQRGGVYQNKK